MPPSKWMFGQKKRHGEETSSDVLRQIRAEGLLAEVSLSIYIGLTQYGPCTGGELARAMQIARKRAGKTVPDWLTPRAVRARLGEIRDRGAVKELEPRNCKVTGRRVIVWAVTGNLPGKKQRRLSAKDRRIQELEAEVERLKLDLVAQTPKKVVICGDRDWDDYDTVKMAVFHHLKPGDIIIEGDCRGADRMGEKAAVEFGLDCWVFQADWNRYGRAAGPKRNQKMLEQEPDEIWAFHPDLSRSKGTRDMVKRALKAGVVVRYFDGESEHEIKQLP